MHLLPALLLLSLYCQASTYAPDRSSRLLRHQASGSRLLCALFFLFPPPVHAAPCLRQPSWV